MGKTFGAQQPAALRLGRIVESRLLWVQSFKHCVSLCCVLEHHLLHDMKILVTGATGFAGSAVLDALKERHSLTVVIHQTPLNSTMQQGRIDVIHARDLCSNGIPIDAMQGIDVVLHMAGRAHVMREQHADSLAEYRRANVQTTDTLARQAAAAQVKRFVYVSSIKALAEQSFGHALSETAAPKPVDDYGISKLEAEQKLLTIAADTRLEVVIVRPSLIYGPNVKGNLATAMQWIARGVPLPFGALTNLRSLLYVKNFADALVACVEKEAAAGQVFHVCDSQDLSTPQLLLKLSEGMGASLKLFKLPPSVLRFIGTLTGRSDAISRLTESLQVDSSKIRRLLGWQPRHSVDEGLHNTGRSFIEQRQRSRE